MTVYFIRHGFSKANKKQIWGGDSSLHIKGIFQALRLKKELTNKNFKCDILICSEHKRTKQTARIIFPKMKIEIDKRFNEMDYGIYSDKRYDRDLSKDKVREVFEKNPKEFHLVTKGDDFTKRAEEGIAAIKEICNKNENKTIVIVSSAAIIKCILTVLKFNDINKICGCKVRNCELIKVIIDNEKVEIDPNIF